MTGVEEGAALGAGAAGTGAVAGGLTAAQWAALAASVGGTAASYVGQQQQADDRRDILNKQLQSTKAAEDKSATLVNQEGQNYQGDAREAAMQAQQQATLAQSQKDLGTAPTIINGAGDAGAVSSDYLAAKDATNASEGTRLSAIAQELAKTRSPGQLMTSEGLRRANLAGVLQDMWSAQRNGNQAAQADAQGVEEPWWGQAGKVAAAGGTSYLGSSLGKGAANGTNYSLTGSTSLGDNASQPSFWNTAGKVRFKG